MFPSTSRAAIARRSRGWCTTTRSPRSSRPGASEPLVTHLPLLLVADCEPHGTLFGHFARANPHAQSDPDVESVAIFHGPHAYVTPSWYADPAGAVPTWNYAVAHAHGAIELARDAAETRAVLDLMIQRFESGRAAPWQLGLDPAPPRGDGRRDHRLSHPRETDRGEAQALAEPVAGRSAPRRGGPRRRRLRRGRGHRGVDARHHEHVSESRERPWAAHVGA